MLFILKLVLIILLNETYAYTTHDAVTILLPAWKPTDTKKISLTLKIFGKLIQLNLSRNDHTVSPTFEVGKYNAKSVTEKLSELKKSDPCFYLHKDHISSAVINFCHEHGLEGLIFVESNTFEIRPLQNEFASLSLIDDFREQTNLSFGKLHLIKKLLQPFAVTNLYHSDNFKLKRRHVRNLHEKLTIELAVFLDKAAYNTFMPVLDNDKEKLRNMILAYVNQIQAVFHHPSLGVSIDISLVYLEIMEKQPLNLPVFHEFVENLTHSFCEYAESLNPPNDSDPRHWDISLYLTGMDLYQTVRKRAEYSIMGIAYIDGVCNGSFSCAIVECGVPFEIPFESSGLSFSSSAAAHEIGHVLGLEHDITNPFEPKMGNENITVMFYRQYYRGYKIWSENSRNKLKNLWETKSCLRDHRDHLDDAFDHSRYHGLPGREWNAKAQCELFFLDKDANVVTLHEICQALQCETPHKNNSYFSGPALDGTHCALGKECRGGECVPVIEPPYIFKYCEDDNWSEWIEDSCNSNCLEKSKGVIVKRRFCKHGIHRTANCIGPYYDVVLCDNSSNCFGERKTITNFTAIKCTKFSSKIPKLQILKLPGMQSPHETDRPWIACTIHCQRENYIHPYYAPRVEMIAFGVNPYFPDGTWCHRDGNQDYFCRKHHCLPENYTFRKKLPTYYFYVNEDMEEL